MEGKNFHTNLLYTHGTWSRFLYHHRIDEILQAEKLQFVHQETCDFDWCQENGFHCSQVRKQVTSGILAFSIFFLIFAGRKAI